MNRCVATIGMFDGVHKGHRLIIDEIKRIAAADGGSDTLIVTFTNHPLSVICPEKAPRLLTPGEEKVSLLESTGIDRIVMKPFTPELQKLSASEFMTMLHDNYNVTTLVMGFNNRFGSDRDLTFENYRKIGRENGIEIVKAPEFRLDSLSVNSTSIRKALLDGDVALAGRMLGRPYSISGKVVKGEQLGRTIGFPTANISIDSAYKLIPSNGVYACMATLPDGNSHPAMVNIGTRPTVSEKNIVSVEAHIISLNRDLYNEEITLSFIEKMRGEQKFESLDQLQKQLITDKENLITITSNISAKC